MDCTIDYNSKPFVEIQRRKIPALDANNGLRTGVDQLQCPRAITKSCNTNNVAAYGTLPIVDNRNLDSVCSHRLTAHGFGWRKSTGLK